MKPFSQLQQDFCPNEVHVIYILSKDTGDDAATDAQVKQEQREIGRRNETVWLAV